MKKEFFCYIISLLTTVFCVSQNLQKGFTLLETGKYNEAETYFKKTLVEFPNNKTAKLCYGRAVGLNGNPSKAKVIFNELLQVAPRNFELKLNYGESLLWNKEFKQAKEYYTHLIAIDATSFPALLGYANTLSNLKEYQTAIVYVDKALEVSKNNSNALTSKKYMYLGWAYQELQNNHHAKAIHILKTIFKQFPKDKDIYLNLANTYTVAKQYKNAELLYVEMCDTKALFFTAKNGLALIAHLQENNKKALEISNKTLEQLNEQNSKKDQESTQERYVQALIWNRKFKAAQEYINTLDTSKTWVLGLKATLYTYTGDFKNTLKTYNHILKEDPSSFDGNLGKANALKANNQTKKAYEAAKHALTLFPNQTDIENFIIKINQSLLPSITSSIAYGFDNGDSEAYTFTNKLNIPVTTKTSVKAIYNYKDAFNNVTHNDSKSIILGLGIGHQLHPQIYISALAGIDKVRGNKNDYEQFYAHLLIKTQPFKLQNLDVGYKRELQNFNAELLNRNIVQNHFYTNYNISTNFNLGWFTQYFYTSQSDGNQRNLFFTSLYYNILRKPVLKTGVNYQFLAFKNQVPSTYFSPSKFNAVEVFINLLKDKAVTKNKNMYYGLTAAVGYQFIEAQSKQSTYRVQANLGYKFNEFCTLESYVNHSNIASAAASGFTFTEFGLKFKWLFLKKPVFQF